MAGGKNKMTRDQIMAVASYKVANPGLTGQEIADHFQISKGQAYYAIKRYVNSAKMLIGNRSGKVSNARLLEPYTDETEAIKKQIRIALGQIDSDDSMAIANRVELLHKITRIRQYLQMTDLQSHLKRADAAIIAAIIRRFVPDITDDDIIKIYHEELEKEIARTKGSMS